MRYSAGSSGSAGKPTCRSIPPRRRRPGWWCAVSTTPLLRQRVVLKGRVREALHAAPAKARWLVFDAEAVTHVDATGAEALIALTNDLRRDGIVLVLARLRTRMQQQLENAGVLEAIGRGRLYPSVRSAVDAFDGKPQGV